MKKTNILKFALTLVMAFAISGVFAQVADADYSEYDGGAAAPNDIDYVTVGSEMGYYALPDPAYHPSYSAPGWALTAGFVWDWTVPTDPGTAATVEYPVATFPANYVEITYPVVGNYVVNVAERAPAAFGGCVDGTPTVLNVTAVAVPTGTMSIAPTGWQEITANQSYQICGDQLAEQITIAFTENVPNGLGAYSFQITETIELLDGAGNPTSATQAETVIEDWAGTSKLKAGNLDGNGDLTTLPSAAFVTATPSFTFTFDSDALNVLQDGGGTDARTRYTYTVTRSGDTGNNDFRSAISHKSDYLAVAPNYYNFTVSTVSFIVNPEPVTGPIYHINNTFNY